MYRAADTPSAQHEDGIIRRMQALGSTVDVTELVDHDGDLRAGIRCQAMLQERGFAGT